MKCEGCQQETGVRVLLDGKRCCLDCVHEDGEGRKRRRHASEVVDRLEAMLREILDYGPGPRVAGSGHE